MRQVPFEQLDVWTAFLLQTKKRLELHDVFQGATDRDSFYTLALPYRDSVLAGYTEKLIGLLQLATSQ
jgi:hypothetical protein